MDCVMNFRSLTSWTKKKEILRYRTQPLKKILFPIDFRHEKVEKFLLKFFQTHFSKKWEKIFFWKFLEAKNFFNFFFKNLFWGIFKTFFFFLISVELWIFLFNLKFLIYQFLISSVHKKLNYIIWISHY